jgi:hypothetical protein
MLSLFAHNSRFLGVLAGGIFVDHSARSAFQKRFYDGGITPDQVHEYIETAMNRFVSEVKPSFENPAAEYPIAVADRQVTNSDIGIQKGYLTLMGRVLILLDVTFYSIRSQL